MPYQTYFAYDLAPVSRFDDFALTVQWLTGSTDPATATPVDLTVYSGGTFQVWGNPEDTVPLATGTVALGTAGNITMSLSRTAVAGLGHGRFYYSVVLTALAGTYKTLMRGLFPVM